MHGLAGTCRGCRECGEGEYKAGGCNGTSDTICRNCSAIACEDGKYLAGCGRGSEGECRACPAEACKAGEYLTGCGGQSNGTCTGCGSCRAGEYLTGCGGRSNGKQAVGGLGRDEEGKGLARRNRAREGGG